MPVAAVVATSVREGKGSKYVAARALDGRAVSAWCEGKPDEGIGEGLTITFVAPTVIDEVSIEGGVHTSEQEARESNLPLRFEVTTSDGRKLTAETDVDGKAVVRLGGAAIERLFVGFAAVEKTESNASCITQITLRKGARALVPVLGATAATVAELPQALAEITEALTSCDPAQLEARLRYPLWFKRPAEKNPVFQDSYPDLRQMVKACKAGKGPAGAPTLKLVRGTDFRRLLQGSGFWQTDVILSVRPRIRRSAGTSTGTPRAGSSR